MAKRKRAKKKPKKPRNAAAITAIVHCKGGSHKNKRKKSDDLWKQELDNHK
jgi:hypothetical protein